MKSQESYVRELPIIETFEINGGVMLYPKVPKWFKGSIWGLGIAVVIDNWSDIKSGIIDGFTDALSD